MVKKITAIVSFLLITGGLLVFILIWKQEKTAYIEIEKVYNEFDYKKELEKKLNATKLSRQNIIDSMEFQLRILSKAINDEKGKDKTQIRLFEVKREDYIQKKQDFEEDNQALVKQYDEQILKQMTQYVQDYGKKYGYTYIYGASGNGALMYAEEHKNITDKIIIYINRRYKGLTD